MPFQNEEVFGEILENISLIEIKEIEIEENEYIRALCKFKTEKDKEIVWFKPELITVSDELREFLKNKGVRQADSRDLNENKGKREEHAFSWLPLIFAVLIVLTLFLHRKGFLKRMKKKARK